MQKQHKTNSHAVLLDDNVSKKQVPDVARRSRRSILCRAEVTLGLSILTLLSLLVLTASYILVLAHRNTQGLQEQQSKLIEELQFQIEDLNFRLKETESLVRLPERADELHARVYVDEHAEQMMNKPAQAKRIKRNAPEEDSEGSNSIGALYPASLHLTNRLDHADSGTDGYISHWLAHESFVNTDHRLIHDADYELEANGVIKMKKPGLYWIQAQLSFESRDASPSSFDIFIENGTDNPLRAATCTLASARRRGTTVQSCYTSIVMSLLTNAKVYLKVVERHKTVNLDDHMSFIGITRL